MPTVTCGAGSGNELVGGDLNIPCPKDKGGYHGPWLLLHFSKMSPSVLLLHGEVTAARVESFDSHRKPGVYKLQVTLF